MSIICWTATLFPSYSCLLNAFCWELSFTSYCSVTEPGVPYNVTVRASTAVGKGEPVSIVVFSMQQGTYVWHWFTLFVHLYWCCTLLRYYNPICKDILYNTRHTYVLSNYFIIDFIHNSSISLERFHLLGCTDINFSIWFIVYKEGSLWGRWWSYVSAARQSWKYCLLFAQWNYIIQKVQVMYTTHVIWRNNAM